MEISSATIGALIGAVVAFLITTLIFKTRSTSKADLEQANKDLAQVRLDLGVARQREQTLEGSSAVLEREKASLSGQEC